MFEKIKWYYDEGLWSELRIRNLVKNNKLSKEEYKLIVGNKYEE